MFLRAVPTRTRLSGRSGLWRCSCASLVWDPVATVQHTVLRKVLSDYSRSWEVLSDPHKLLELYSNCPAPENSHPKEFMMQMFVPDFSGASTKWLRSSGFA